LGGKQQRVVESNGERDKRSGGALTLGNWHKRIVGRLQDIGKCAYGEG
jgi:hypothetical protein